MYSKFITLRKMTIKLKTKVSETIKLLETKLPEIEELHEANFPKF